MAGAPETAVFPPLRRLRPVVPLWAFGLEGPWLGRHLAEELAAQVPAHPELAGIRAALAVWRFERHPLDPACLRQVLALGRAAPPGVRALARSLAPRLGPPAAARDWPALRDGPDVEAALAALARGLADRQHGLYWLGKALEYAFFANLPELADRALAGLAGLADQASAAVLAPRLAAETAAAFAGSAETLDALEHVDTALFPRFAALARSQALIAAGETSRGTDTLLALWRRDNWHPGLTLRCCDLLFPVPPADLDALAGRLYVFIYTWNRAGLLDRTLASLAGSRLGPARVMVLDNGSGDDTRAVCRRAAARFAPGRFETITLPVNIGAPAARNWLAAAAGLAPGDLAAYLDDDVLVPNDWLAALAGALAADPGAQAAGARILCGATTIPQSADVHLLAPQGNKTVLPLVNCPRGPDFGLTAASRPCPSVSGCCHLLRGEALAGPAPFDIRFSPSQFDDLARDVRAYLSGCRCVLAGNVAVAHFQPSRAGARPGRSLGAKAKLDGLFAAPDMAVAAARDLDTAWEELSAKWTRISRFSRACTGGD